MASVQTRLLELLPLPPPWDMIVLVFLLSLVASGAIMFLGLLCVWLLKRICCSGLYPDSYPDGPKRKRKGYADESRAGMLWDDADELEQNARSPTPLIRQERTNVRLQRKDWRHQGTGQVKGVRAIVGLGHLAQDEEPCVL